MITEVFPLDCIKWGKEGIIYQLKSSVATDAYWKSNQTLETVKLRYTFKGEEEVSKMSSDRFPFCPSLTISAVCRDFHFPNTKTENTSTGWG